MDIGQRVIVQLDAEKRSTALVKNWSGLHATVTNHVLPTHIELFVDHPPTGGSTIVIWTREVVPETVDIEEDPY